MSRDVLKIKKTGLLGEILLDLKLLTPEKLEIALKEQSALDKTTHRRIGEILVSLGFISEDDMLRALSTKFDLTYLKFSEFPKTIPKQLNGTEKPLIRDMQWLNPIWVPNIIWSKAFPKTLAKL